MKYTNRSAAPVARVAIFSVLASLLAVPALASNAPVTPRSMRYEIRKGPVVVGKARIDINRPTKRKSGPIQKVLVKANIDPLGNAAVRVNINSKSWIGSNLFPKKAVWDWSSFGKDRKVRARFNGRAIDGTYSARDKVIRTKTRKPRLIGDIVSFAAWLAGQKFEPGSTVKTTTYTGLKLYDVTLDVGQPTEMEFNVGKRTVLPMAGTAVRPGKTRKFTLWLDAQSGSLMKVRFHADIIGDLDMVLVRERR